MNRTSDEVVPAAVGPTDSENFCAGVSKGITFMLAWLRSPLAGGSMIEESSILMALF